MFRLLFITIVFLTTCISVFAEDAGAVGEGSGKKGGYVPKETQNSNCDVKEARICQAEVRVKLDECSYTPLSGCKALAQINYAQCKASAGCK